MRSTRLFLKKLSGKNEAQTMEAGDARLVNIRVFFTLGNALHQAGETNLSNAPQSNYVNEVVTMFDARP